MTKKEIFKILKKNILEVLFDLEENLIIINKSLKDLGANSVDRVEIVTKTLEDCNVKVPLVELAKIKNMQGLVDFLYDQVS